MNQQEYMNRIFQNQITNQPLLVCLQYQPLMFQYIPQMYCGELTQQNTEIKYVSNYCNGTINYEQQNQSNQQQPKLQEMPQSIKNETEREIKESKFNGHWSKQEHELYLEFVNNHFDILKSKYDKKSKKIFKLMSKFITTRTPTQCRSHHQKFNPLQSNKKKKNSRLGKY
ncbi:unnamed protein product [Paramecium primaurelia]|uniref:Myb-like domain-containing protein n=1 Tax=Paramecium primaurelia TaxID=5886 RepID=A0A8S1PMI3_PARPR|nr:unnamed protein product [Paramecium primaurelia]